MSADTQPPTRDSDTSGDDERFDEFARRAGASLRSPAPRGGAAAAMTVGRRQRITKSIAGVSAVAAMLIAGIALARRGGGNGDGLVPVTEPIPSSTVASAALTDQQIAESLLLSDAEYAPDWHGYGDPLIGMDGAVASNVPDCQPFLNTVFEGPTRPAAIARRRFDLTGAQSQVTPASMLQYVVVLPTDASAAAMMAGLRDERFLDGCIRGYWDQADAQPSISRSYLPFERPDDRYTPATVSLDGDEAVAWTYEYTAAQALPDPSITAAAAVRTGRAVTVVLYLLRTELGELLTMEQFQQAITHVVTKAHRALAEGTRS